jgi:thiamine pyrophosphate-dependent acetolactate synthase large subunit-like protein
MLKCCYTAALNLPGLNAVAVAEAYGCPAFRADTPADLYEAFQKARNVDGPVLIEFQINPKLEALPIKSYGLLTTSHW